MKLLLKYKYHIIITLLLILCSVLIYRWYKNKDGFTSNPVDILTRQETINYSYLWDNNLFVEQFTTPPETIISLWKPLSVNDTNALKQLGSVINTAIEKTTDALYVKHKATVMVDSDVRPPSKLKEVYKMKNTVENKLNDVFTKNMLTKRITYNANLKTDIENNFNSILTELENVDLSNYYKIKLLNEFENTNNYDTNLNISNSNYDIPVGRYNGLSMPYDAIAELNFNMALDGNMKKTISFNTDITDENDLTSIYKNTGFNSDTFNVFNKHGLGFKNFRIENEIKEYTQGKTDNNSEKFSYNFGIGNGSTYSGLNEKNSIYNYFMDKLNNLKNNNMIRVNDNNLEVDENPFFSNINNDQGVKFISYNGKNEIYFVDHIHKITPGSFDGKDIVLYDDGQNESQYREWMFDGYDGYKNLFLNNESFVLSYRARFRGAIKDRNWENIDDNLILSSDIYNKRIERKYGNDNIPQIDEGERTKIIPDDSENFYLWDELFNTNGKTINDKKQYEYKVPLKVFHAYCCIYTIEDLHKPHKRRALAQLWNEGKLTNWQSNTTFKVVNGVSTEHITISHREKKRWSNWTEFTFQSISQARQYVANMLNRLDKKLSVPFDLQNNIDVKTVNVETKVLKVKNTLNITTKTVDLRNPEVNEKLTNLEEIIRSYKLNIDLTELKNLLNTEKKLYYVDLQFSLPLYRKKISWSTIGSEQFNNANLYTGQINNLLLRSGKVSIPENNQVNKIYTEIKNKLIDLKTKYLTSLDTGINDIQNIINKMNNQQLELTNLSIYRPIAPRKYKSLGDIVINKEIDIQTELNSIGCVPEHCVVSVRPWIKADKVYEHNMNGDYLALYKNPYLNTFRAVTVAGVLPEGEVEKVVACVAKCDMVDKLIESDKCANEYKRGFNKINGTNNLGGNSALISKQDKAYFEMISSKQDYINKLKEQINEISYQDKQGKIVNQAYNRAKLQKLISTQEININKLINKLFKYVNININKAEFLAKLQALGIDINEVSFTITPRTDDNTNTTTIIPLPTDIEDEILNNVNEPTTTTTQAQTGSSTSPTTVSGETSASGAPTNDVVSDPERLKGFLYSLSEDQKPYAVRSLVESSCGCYFTDEELTELM